MSTNYADVQWYEQMRLEAEGEAKNAYQQSQMANEGEKIALEKAKLAWQQTLDKAGLTGMYEGAPTQAALQFGANTFGTWGAPQQGQQTLAGQQQGWQQAYNTANQFGQYYGTGQAPAVGTKTQQQLEQEYTQGLRTQQEQRAAQGQQQTQTQDYLKILAGLRGPADWMKYQEVLGATPGGMRDLYAAAMGQYVPGGGATTGMAPSAVNLSTMGQQVAGQPVTMGGPQQQLYSPSMYQFNPAVYGQQPGQDQAQANLQQLQPDVWRQQAAQQPGQAYDPTRAQTQQQYMQTQAVNAQGGGTNTMGAQPAGAPAANQMNLPAPNQIASQSWNNMAPSQKEMLLGQYESQGWHKPDVEALMNQALPKYASNAPTAGTMRLR